MELREPPKSRSKGEVELDRIGNLPSNVMVKILSCLTLKEAVRTCVFSSKWRDKWTMLSDLVFDETHFSSQNNATFANIVDHVLLNHIGPIHKFRLCTSDSTCDRDIDRWLLHLSRKSIKVFDIVCPHNENSKYKMPLCFYDYQDMIELKLYLCLLKPPTKFKGFVTLNTVALWLVTLAQDVLDNLSLCCPLLESLKMFKCDGFTHLKIDAPNLRFLSFSGSLEDVCLQNALNLTDVSFELDDIYHRGDRVRVNGFAGNLVKFFNDLPHIEHLEIGGIGIQYLAVGDLPGRLPKPCLDLCNISLSVCFKDLGEILTTLCLLRSSPSLEELFVMVSDGEVNSPIDEEANSWLDNLDDDINCSFPKLRIVQLNDFSGCKDELDFIKFLLLSAPVLETMTIDAISAVGSSKILKQLLQFRRMSCAEIIYLDPLILH